MEVLVVFSGLLTPVIAIVGIFIAYRQWRTAQNKLRLDLFERRLEVYEAIEEFASKSQWARGRRDELDAVFFDAMKKARWLFGAEILWFCRKRIFRCADDLNEMWVAYDKARPEEQKVLMGQIIEKKKELYRLRRELLHVFSPYMSLKAK